MSLKLACSCLLVVLAFGGLVWEGMRGGNPKEWLS